MNSKIHLTALLFLLGAMFVIIPEVNAQVSVSTCAELEAIGSDVTTLGESYILIQDLDCGPNGENYKQINPGFTPIGGNTPPGTSLPSVPLFTGVFDGNGHSINGLFIELDVFTGNNYIGLFGRTGPTAVIKDLTLLNTSIAGQASVGALVGRNEGFVTGVTVTNATLNALAVVGGVAGANFAPGHIEYSTVNNVNVTGNRYTLGPMDVGGLVGDNRSHIFRSSSGGIVTGVGAVGVFVPDVGGLVGENYGLAAFISQSYSEAEVAGPCRTGGLVGSNIQGGRIIDSYATGDVSASANPCLFSEGDDIAGLVGLNFGAGSNITNSYSTGVVTPGNPIKSGGAVGENLNSASCVGVFWDTDTSGFLTSACGTGETTVGMQTESTFTSVNWDFSSTWVMVDYPRLQWQTTVGQLIEELTEEIEQLLDDGVIPRHVGHPLTQSIEQATNHLGKGQISLTLNLLDQFVAKLERAVASGEVPPMPGIYHNIETIRNLIETRWASAESATSNHIAAWENQVSGGAVPPRVGHELAHISQSAAKQLSMGHAKPAIIQLEHFEKRLAKLTAQGEVPASVSVAMKPIHDTAVAAIRNIR